MKRKSYFTCKFRNECEEKNYSIICCYEGECTYEEKCNIKVHDSIPNCLRGGECVTIFEYLMYKKLKEEK